MKNKGFTLIELLGVIIVLSVLVVIVGVTVTNVLKGSESKLTDIQIEKLKDAAKNYYINEGMDSTDFEQDNFSHCVSINYLIENGYIDKNEISNFETGEDILGSIKINYNNKKYEYTYTEDSCKVCSLIDDTGETGISPGDKYQCKVKDNMEKDFENGYYFYVLGTNEEGTTNLIMDRNINSDGTPATKGRTEAQKGDNDGKYNLVAWINQGDYELAGGQKWDNLTDNNTFGPITAMNFLTEATKTWTNTNKIIINFFDDTNATQKSMKTYNTYARMPYYYEVGDSNGTNEYLYEYLDGSYWSGFEGNQPTNNINGIFGYWTLSAATHNFSYAWLVDFSGHITSTYVGESARGVRPVITLPKNRFENSNW